MTLLQAVVLVVAVLGVLGILGILMMLARPLVDLATKGVQYAEKRREAMRQAESAGQ
jgi:type II secretory pathway pseudopilin PulG